MKIQPRVRGGREQLPSCVIRPIRSIVNATAKKFGVSRSWVVAVALGDAFGIDVPSYEDRPRRRRR